jgi:D-alanyl-lipoteichoic acid acyltransferase DltB (MBOAT superfamily)
VSGFWHGANWTFIVWGALNALYFLPLLLLNKNRQHIGIVAQGKYFPTLREFFQIIITFGLTVFAWIFFRAENIGHAFNYISEIFSISTFNLPDFKEIYRAYVTLGLVAFFMMLEWFGRDHEFAIEKLMINRSRMLRWSFYSFIIFMIIMFAQTEETPFIYFQF